MGTIRATLRPGAFPTADLRSGRVGFAARTLELLTLLMTWHDRAVQRRALESLDDRQLKDIGLSRAEVVQESLKPFWQA